MIKKVVGGYQLRSQATGRNLGSAPTMGGIKKREAQVQYFKKLRSQQKGY